MGAWEFESMATPQGWLSPAFVETDVAGLITSLDTKPREGVSYEKQRGWVLPGFCNGHSHSFQYAGAGLTEYLPQGAQHDDFWSWREKMYQLALKVTPEQLTVIAGELYREMAHRGITSVAEFHYLHHDPKGMPYEDRAMMARALCEAAKMAGIRLCLIPVFYRLGGFNRSAQDHQRRFIFPSVDEYALLVEDSRKIAKEYGFQVGWGVHSLRAASQEEVIELGKLIPRKTPFHIHIAEQMSEVKECREKWKATPIQWLLDHLEVDRRFHLVHATHGTPEELASLASTGAVVVLCPSTEGNLGDGLFPLSEYLKKSGRIAIGTDSHVGVDFLEELRWLEYGQRAQLQKRNPHCEAGQETGNRLFWKSVSGGRSACGLSGKGFEIGTAFDAVVVDSQLPMAEGLKASQRLSSLIFAPHRNLFLGTYVGGKRLNLDSSDNSLYRKTLRDLRLQG